MIEDGWNVARISSQPPLFFKTSGDKFLLKFPFDRGVISKVKTIGMKWSDARKIWYSDLTKMFFQNFVTIFPEAEDPLKLAGLISGNHEGAGDGYSPSSYLMNHQKEAALMASERNRYGFFHDTGTGKCLLAIEIYKQKKIKTLVVAPLSIIEVAWLEDIKKFAPEVKAMNLWEYYKKERTRIGRIKLARILEEENLFIINFETFRNKLDELKRQNFRMLLVDESSYMKDARSQITKALHAFGDNMDYCYLFSGTPAPNNELEYWSQIRMIDPLLFGRSFYQFRNNFFNSYGFGGFKWGMKSEKREEFMRLLSSVSEVVEKNDVLDLPERTTNIRKVYLTEKEWKAYKEMEDELIIEIEDQEVVAANAAVKMMKLREGSSGFFITEDGLIVKTGDSKLKELMLLLEEIGNHQVIIWTQFQYEAAMICEAIQKIKQSWARVDGTVNHATKEAAKKSFMQGKTKYMVAHPKSLGHGVTLVNCSYAVYFSESHSYELDYQSKDRIYRKGQKNACTYYYLIADKTIDMKIFNALKDKKKVVEEVFQYLKKKKTVKEVMSDAGRNDDRS